ncbi:MAG: NADPH-dependent 7-cyano-7-deazaguanine reductase QueF [Desulfobacteraceae bacterium]|nr:NADPH-dependent 7-cyano-7-deazaguanine reductase QueF [Desulfobacteraceae bacterium]
MKLSKNDQSLPLGKTIIHSRTYDPGQLYPIARHMSRQTEAAPDKNDVLFYGEDIWNVYELCWLGPAGKPEIAMAEIRVPCDSPNLVESKSLKLYLNSFNMTRFEDPAQVSETISHDLSQTFGKPVRVKLISPDRFNQISLAEPPGTCIDDKDLDGFCLHVEPDHLRSEAPDAREALYSRLFRSICPVTGQPDYATVAIAYQGPRLRRSGLLSYLVSFREHAGFHEACIEKIFHDIMKCCAPRRLTVYGRFTRRGGIDINPLRSTHQISPKNLRDPRQ